LYELSIVGQENPRLKQQLEKVAAELNSTKAELDRYLLSNPTTHPKVTSIDVKRKTNNSIDKDELKSKISHLGIKMNAKLYEIIKTKSETDIDNAINAVEEYIATGKKVNSKAGLFGKALEENWMPNLTDEERKIANISDDFSEWFKLAKEQGIVQASQGTKEGIIVLEPTGQWTLLSTMLEKGWTLEYLQQRSER
jgi:Tfp pilus assembly protein PilE